MNRSRQMIEVTAGLAVAGAIVGAICAVGIVVLLSAIQGRPTGWFSTDGAIFLGTVALVGAVIGLFVAPAFSWVVLRRVPLGKAILATALGTITGAVIGEVYFPLNPYIGGAPGILLGAFAGFVLGGIAVRLLVRQ